MKLCCICKKTIKIGDLGTLTISENDMDKEICAECEKQISVLTNSDNANEIKTAINYLYSYSLKNDDEEVTSYLNDILEANSSVIDDHDITQENNRPISTDPEKDYFKDTMENESGDFSGQYSLCHKPDKMAVSIFDAAKTATVLGIIAAVIYFIIGAVNITANGPFVLYLGLLIFCVLIFAAFRLLAKILKGFAAIIQNTRDTVRLQKQQADDIGELIKKCNN